MIIPTEDQVYERWDTLPLILKEALTSEANSDFIWKTSEAEHVPDEKIFIIGRAVSHVLLGFIHTEDLLTEIQGTGLDPKTASSIASGITQRILGPLHSEVDKIYQPLKVETAPKIIQDISPVPEKPVPVAPPKVPPKPAPAPLVVNKVIPTAPPLAPPIVSVPEKLAEKGWSKTTAGEPVITFNIPASQKASVPPPLSSSAMPPPKPVTAPVPPTPPPKPIIFQENTGSKPGQATSDFHLSRPGLMAAEAGLDTKKFVEPAVKPAVLELGVITPPQNKIAPQASRVVHYTEFLSSESTKAPMPRTAPLANSGPRMVTEITTVPQAARPPVPPKPPAAPILPPPLPPAPPKAPRIEGIEKMMAPRPPVPPAPLSSPPSPSSPPQPQKVIVKDFLDSGR
jgi:hypothetical protein